MTGLNVNANLACKEDLVELAIKDILSIEIIVEFVWIQWTDLLTTLLKIADDKVCKTWFYSR